MKIKNSSGRELYVEETGAGDPVVLVSGAASSGMFFSHFRFAPLLARRARVVLIDLTGMGRSERVEEVSPTQWCEDVVSVLDALGLEDAHLGGVSLGARIVGRVALEHPKRVRSIWVDNPIVAVDPAAESHLSHFFDHPDEAPAHQQEGWKQMHGDDWREVVAFYARARSNRDLQGYLTLRPRLAEIGAPTFITRGDLDDEAHPLAQAFEWHQNAPRTSLWIAPGSTASSTVRDFPVDLDRYYGEFLGHLASPAGESR